MLHRVEIHSSLDAASQPRVFARLLVGNYAIFEPILTLHLLNSRHPVNKSKFCAWAVTGLCFFSGLSLVKPSQRTLVVKGG